MTDEQIAELKRAALAATPQEIDGAQRIEHYEDGSHIACPACGGEGDVPYEADFCNYDGVAIGVQFYGIGNEFGAAEAYFRAAKPANVLDLIADAEMWRWFKANYGALSLAEQFASDVPNVFTRGLKSRSWDEIDAAIAKERS